jgi:SAM-dependent methyltransferase
MSNELRIEKTLEIYDKHSSDFYDYHASRNDINFFLNYAKDIEGEILDLGCGTGRILIPVAKTGKKITGIDNSDFMLENCQNKIAKETEAIRKNIIILKSDISNFNLNKIFSLVIIPFGPFNSLIKTEDQLNCLLKVNQHLNDKGTLVFDVWYPNNNELVKSEANYHVVKDQPFFTLEDGRKVQWGIINKSVDYNRQIIYEEMYYNVDYPDGKKEKLIYPAQVRYFYRYEIEHLLSLSGFKINKIYSDFEKNEFGVKYPSELIVEAKK